MKKEEVISRYGEAAYQKRLAQHREWDKRNREKNPDKAIEKDRLANQEQDRKGGRYYDRKQIYLQTGLQGDRNRIRCKHRNMWRPLKNLIAPESQIHHLWVDGTASYLGVALVEKEAHRRGVINVVHILEGEITE